MIEKDLKDKVIELLTEKGVNCERCIACSKKTLSIADVWVKEMNSALFICRNCGYLAQYSLLAIGLERDGLLR